jgi:D-alanyl-lipoteichoic acid acyltransferase DltB (MBOAT superfamily)
VVLFYYLLPIHKRWIWLLIASYFFYGFWKVEYLTLIVATTILDFYIARAIYNSDSTVRKRCLLALTCSVNLGTLFLFKYLVLFLGPMDPMRLSIFSAENPFLGNILFVVYYALPVGISFYTFQTMSYTIDVYYGRCVPERNLGKFALFISYFPQLVAGPIERFSHLQPQLLARHLPTYENFSKGFRLLVFGFFVKVCIADNLAIWVDEIYADPGQYIRPHVWLGTFIFGIQIYCDFSGYTLIAQGSAMLMGITLMDNFRTPYLSASVTEFWQRWHISLSTWFRDYLYIPLGGSRVAVPRWVFNIMIVFALSGFWHGANWTFMIWGAIHGVMYLIERLWSNLPGAGGVFRMLKKPFGVLLTFTIVHLAWVFFRIDKLENLETLWNALFHSAGVKELTLKASIWLMLGLFVVLDLTLYNKRIDKWLDGKPFGFRWLLYAIMLFCILSFGGLVNHPFIYFQF